MMIQVRTSRIEDAPFITANNIAMALESEGRDLHPSEVLQGVEAVMNNNDEHAFYLVAEADGAEVGNLMVTREWSDWTNRWAWWIQSVYVLPDYRGKGIYRSLYNTVVEMAAQQNVKVIRLYVDADNTAAQEVYGRLGMKTSHYQLYEQYLP